MNLYSGQLRVAIKAINQESAEAIFNLAYGNPSTDSHYTLATMEVVDFSVECVEDDIPPYEFAVKMHNDLGDNRTIILYAETYTEALNTATKLANEHNPPAGWPVGLPCGTWTPSGVRHNEETQSEDNPD